MRIPGTAVRLESNTGLLSNQLLFGMIFRSAVRDLESPPLNATLECFHHIIRVLSIDAQHSSPKHIVVLMLAPLSMYVLY